MAVASPSQIGAGGTMKTLLSGIVGAAAATAAWLALEHVTQREFGWLACLVGLITGLSVHWAAGSHARASFVRGALAVLLTLAACVGGRMVYVKVMESVLGDLDAQMAQVDKPVDGEGEVGADTQNDSAVASDQDAEAAETTPKARQTDMPAASMKIKKPTVKATISQADMLWLCVAALAAYVVGKGNDKQPTTTAPAGAQEQPPAQT
jgi:hypothetical protein